MSNFYLYSRNNTAKEIKCRNEDKLITKNDWINVINNDEDCTWSVDTDLGKMHLELLVKKNVPDEDLEKFKFAGVYCFINKNKYPTDFQIAYFGYMIEFVYKRLTRQRLEKMKELADKLDCYLVNNYSIVDEAKYLKLLEKTK